MKFSNALLCLAATTHGINAVAVPDVNVVALDTRTPQPDLGILAEPAAAEELWKRKGGGGGGGRGGGGGGGGGSTGGRGGGGSTGGGGNTGGRGGGSTGGRGGVPLSSPSSNVGGRTTTGSGPPPRFGGFYNGGAAVPYAAGRSSGSIAPFFLGGAAVGLLAFSAINFPFGVWSYPYHNQYFYHNSTTNQNETKPVTCVCGAFDTCSCADNGNQTYFASIIGNGSYQGLNHSLVSVAKNDTTGQLTIFLNGDVPNGTTAAGGTDSPTDVNIESGATAMRALVQTVGWWPAAAVAVTIALSL
ncbi:hypothetical protein GGR50DRAFT_555826 [Xylaria sp. CBS 124048]|nr:hypothetical protein GGR50DRAFT_555826 [Xylaria sp. CBS 124048]